MNEANAELLDSELLRDAEATNQRPALADGAVDHLTESAPPDAQPSPGDELKTTRMPSVTPPPPLTAGLTPLPPLATISTMVPPPMAASYRPPMPSVPPPLPSHASGTHQSYVPPPVASHAPYLPNDTTTQGKPSWLRALLTSTLPPPATTRNPSVRAPISAGTAGVVFAALGLVFAVVALVTGLRGMPDASIAPVVAAALVIARSLVTLGSGALSFVLLRSAERLLVDPGVREPSANDTRSELR